MKRLPLFIAPTLALAALLMPQRAHAADIWINKAGVGVACQLAGQATFIVQPWDGSPCQAYPLGIGGLNNHYRLIGTDSVDWWTFAGSSTTVCGFAVTPINQNGFHLDFEGNLGDDVLFGGYQDNWVYGGDGNDAISLGRAQEAEGHGWGGNDKLMSGNHLDALMWGDWDNDLFCVPRTTTAWIVNGGGGYDKLCGNAEETPLVDEFPNSTTCKSLCP